MRLRKKTEEHKRKIGDAHRGRTLTLSQKLRLSLLHRGKKASDAQRLAMSVARKGKKRDPESVRKGVESRKGYVTTKEEVEKRLLSQGLRPFDVYDIKNQCYVGTFLVRSECCRELGIDKEMIRNGLLGKVKRPRKYLFMKINMGNAHN